MAGIAAAIGIVQLKSGDPADTRAKAETTTVETEAPEATQEPVADARPKKEREPGGVNLDELPEQDPDTEEDETSPPGAGGPLAVGGPLPTPEATAAPEATEKPEETKPEKPKKSETGGDLHKEMAEAAGTTDKEDDDTEAKPAAGSNGGNQSIPAHPSQGSVAAAIGAVMGNAKACVAGADDVSRATITFGSSGSVSNVSVSGWAAGKGASGCIQSALKAANVGPFSKSSYTFGVTVRP